MLISFKIQNEKRNNILNIFRQTFFFDRLLCYSRSGLFLHTTLNLYHFIFIRPKSFQTNLRSLRYSDFLFNSWHLDILLGQCWPKVQEKTTLFPHPFKMRNIIFFYIDNLRKNLEISLGMPRNENPSKNVQKRIPLKREMISSKTLRKGEKTLANPGNNFQKKYINFK